MQIIHCAQGDPVWMAARCGKITASRISDIVTPQGKATANAARRRYSLELAGERITHDTGDHYETPAMARGKALEATARMWYQLATKATVAEVGFCLHDSGVCGASPDGLVGDDGGIEIKCPLLPHYLDVMHGGPPAIDAGWRMQCHFTMAVTGRAWWDFVLYTDVLPFGGWVHRIDRDDDLCGAIMAAVADFHEEVAAVEVAIRKRAGLTD